MPRATQLLAVTTVVALAASAYLVVENRSLRRELTARAPTQPLAEALAARPSDPWTTPMRAGTTPRPHGPAPTLPELKDQKEDSRLERRVRRQGEFAAMFGRLDGETAEEYRARVAPMIATGLAIPRARVEEMRKEAEAAAHITPEQSKKLDTAFDKVYDNVLDYTNKAIADGTLSPYERNVSGWLEYAGGLGTMLNETNGQVGQVLSADQVQAMTASGFEWGEYLGLEAPWEKLTPPPFAPGKH